MSSKTNKPILFSGIQPSGHLQIGHYVGAIKNWINLQNQYHCLFSLVDMHAITVTQDPAALRERCYELLALFIACGLDPEKNIIFVQSHVSAHAELAWILNCFTNMGELNRMTQYKDKSKRFASNLNAGLFDYPVLMAADILLYQTNLVPVGHDQKQHLELTRDIAIRFNNSYGSIFTVPEPYIPKIGGRIMSLQDPSKKMSKSDPDQTSYIALLDSPDVIFQKMKRAITDSGKEIYFNLEEKPGISNLLTLYSLIADKTIAELEQQYQNAGYGTFKNDIAEALINFLTPVQQRYAELRRDSKKLQTILRYGAEAARESANKTLKQVHEVIGFIPN